LLLQCFAQFAEQPRVLDRDDGLFREIAHQLDLLVVEGSNFLTVNDNGADQLFILEHRHG
jgi:hypothetical protein